MSAQMVDGFCAHCKREVAVGDGLKCPTCARYVNPLSLPSVPKPDRALAPATTPAPADPSQTVTLPDIREARKWSESTDALLDALEREESDALAAFEAARLRARNARHAASALRKIRSLVQVGAAFGMKARIKGVPKPAALPSPDAPKTATSANGRWSRDHDACTACGRTEVRHAARGLCLTCYGRAAKSVHPEAAR